MQACVASVSGNAIAATWSDHDKNKMIKMMMQRLRPSSLCLQLCFAVMLLMARVGNSAGVQTVSLSLPDGAQVSALYSPGKAGPAILLLHGFLQTRNYLTVRALGDNLAEKGFTVLAPTLSLDLDARQESMACEAAHVHTLDGDLAEIGLWVQWLEAQGYQDIRLLGHSHGSLQLLAYVAAGAPASVRQLIATSLIGIEQLQGGNAFAAQVELARERVAQGDVGLSDYHLSHCHRYVAAPHSFLSYAVWDSKRMLHELSQLPMAVQVILGGADARMSPGWPDQLRASRVAVSVIADAGHFFDAQHEFDLLDEVLAALDGVAVHAGATYE